MCAHSTHTHKHKMVRKTCSSRHLPASYQHGEHSFREAPQAHKLCELCDSAGQGHSADLAPWPGISACAVKPAVPTGGSRLLSPAPLPSPTVDKHTVNIEALTVPGRAALRAPWCIRQTVLLLWHWLEQREPPCQVEDTSLHLAHRGSNTTTELIGILEGQRLVSWTSWWQDSSKASISVQWWRCCYESFPFPFCLGISGVLMTNQLWKRNVHFWWENRPHSNLWWVTSKY